MERLLPLIREQQATLITLSLAALFWFGGSVEERKELRTLAFTTLGSRLLVVFKEPKSTGK